MIRAVLFDLDGTFADTLPDLASALNQVLATRSFTSVDQNELRPLVSLGGQAMVEHALREVRDQVLLGAVYREFLQTYADNLATHTTVFSGVAEVVTELTRRAIPWGVVTNKRARFTNPLLARLPVAGGATCVVSGDSTPTVKPEPDSLLLASSLVGAPPHQCVYVGDARNDIVAGQRAGMATLVASWGYLPADDDPQRWGANRVLTEPGELIAWLDTGS